MHHAAPAVPAADTEDEERSRLPLPLKGGAFEQSAEWLERERKIVWGLKHLKGGREHTLRVSMAQKGGRLGPGVRGPFSARWLAVSLSDWCSS